MEGTKQSCCGRLSVCALGGALGILTALAVLIIGVLAHFHHYGTAWVNTVSSVYIGFSASPTGIVIGVIWGLVEGFIFGALVACIYNFILRRCPCPVCKKATGQG